MTLTGICELVGATGGGKFSGTDRIDLTTTADVNQAGAAAAHNRRIIERTLAIEAPAAQLCLVSVKAWFTMASRSWFTSEARLLQLWKSTYRAIPTNPEATTFRCACASRSGRLRR